MAVRLRDLFTLLIILPASAANAREIAASTAQEIRNAIDSAIAGDTITIAPGTYAFDASIWTSNDGAPGQPITVRSDKLGDVKLDFRSVEALVINNAHWVIDSLWINAACANPSDCQAGIGVKPPARGFLLLHSRTTNWYQHVKASREPNAEVEDASIVGCEMYNDIARYSQVIDIVGGKRWLIARNYVHDWGGSDNSAFGIFLKGDTSDGLIDQNLVLCSTGAAVNGAMVGISLGQGGTGSDYCPGGQCVCEDRRSIVRNNIVAHCSDTGLHARRSCGGKFLNNTVYDTGAGLQLQEDSPNEPVEIRNNLMSKRIYGGTNYVESNNLQNADAAIFRDIYAAPDQHNFGDGIDTMEALDRGMILADVPSDYCGKLRVGSFDFGAIEFPSVCVTWPWTPDRVATGTPVPDAGVVIPNPVADAGAGGAADAGAEADAASQQPDAGTATTEKPMPMMMMATDTPPPADRTVRGSFGCNEVEGSSSFNALSAVILLLGLGARLFSIRRR